MQNEPKTKVNLAEVNLSFPIGDILRAKQEGFDLGDMGELAKLNVDEVRMFEAACVVCRDRLSEAGVDPREFTAEEFRAFVDAFRSALEIFFPRFRMIQEVTENEVRKIVSEGVAEEKS